MCNRQFTITAVFNLNPPFYIDLFEQILHGEEEAELGNYNTENFTELFLLPLHLENLPKYAQHKFVSMYILEVQ